MSEDGVFRRRRIVAERHIDSLGHVNNAVWVRFVVDLADAHIEALRLGSERTLALGGQWIVRRHEIDYLRPAVAGDELVEETWVESARGARSVRHARFTRVPDGTVLVKARTEWAFVDRITLRPRRIPREVRALVPEVESPPPALQGGQDSGSEAGREEPLPAHASREEG